MKSRSHRLPATSIDQKDDWVEESWTVDCVCGVNFDDGEEMVNCDECGVWVHTRCSRYVKTDKSFVCDKCKNNNNHGSHHLLRNSNDSSEETEVAQLLVELPTKTLRRMDNNPLPRPPPGSYKSSSLTAAHRPFRLWTDIPIEDRVHVQGVPGGGDPVLFSGVSSVFGPQLWKCTGYIPKKFNFRYRELPCWDEEKEMVLEKEDSNKKFDKQMDISADNGAGVLFSLAKMDVLQQGAPPAAAATSVVDSVDVEKKVEDGKESNGFTGKLDGEKSDVLTQQNEMITDRGPQKPSFYLHFEKRKKEDHVNVKDKSGKKKARILEKDGDCNKKIRLHNPDSGPMAVEGEAQCGKGGSSSYPLPTRQLSLDPGIVGHAIDVLKSGFKDNERHQVPLKLEESSKTMIGVSLFSRSNASSAIPAKEEVTLLTPNISEVEVLASSGTGMQQPEQVQEDLPPTGLKSGDDRSVPDSSLNTVVSCPEIYANSKKELINGNGDVNVNLSSVYDAKLSTSGTAFQSQEIAACHLSENFTVNHTNVPGLLPHDSKVKDAVRRSEIVDLHKRIDSESPLDHCKPRSDSAVSDEFSDSKNSSWGSGRTAHLEFNKSIVTIPSPRVVTGEGKVTVSVANSIPSSAILMPKSLASENRNIGATSLNDNLDSKQRRERETSVTVALTEVVEDEGRHDKTRKLMKELSKSGLGSVPKSSQLKKLSHTAINSKRTSSDSKDSVLGSSSSPTQMPAIASCTTSEMANTRQTESPLNTQKMSSTLFEYSPNIEKAATESQWDFHKMANKSSESALSVEKAVADRPLNIQKVPNALSESASNTEKLIKGSSLSQKGEKTNQTMSQSSSKLNNAPTHAAASSNSPSTLSDEELALLLHQELNSSPRVPRVPRMRHAGSLPQLASPTATSMLMKRTSSSGGKDHVLAFRRKTKGFAKDVSIGYGEMDDEANKMERASSSADHRRQDSAFISDSVGRREVDSGSANGLHNTKKINPPSRTAASSSLSSPAEGNESIFSATRLSPRVPSDDEKGVVGRLTHRTLPGLLAEIMSEGKRMTYEELCNSVLPHWPYLRKHNGERYAYSSHSQAVLDCLRNRNEWARLIDRGPKTSGGRKRRKVDTGAESEENDDSRDRSAKDASRRGKTNESHNEEFPKGKRKARKRRRLALQGRGIKDVRRRRKMEEVSDEEDGGSFSDSSEEAMFSEDEVRGSANDASANSDETENM